MTRGPVPATERDLGAFRASLATALAALVLTYVALRGGWLGPDVGRGESFCEAARPGLLEQPANSLSNLGFVVAGLAVGWHARLGAGRLARPGLATAYAVLVVLLGPASMAMHATQSELGGRLDQLSMYLVAGFAAAYALIRVLDRATTSFVGCFAALVVLSEAVEQLGSHVPVVHNAGNAAFAVVLATAIGLEVLLRRRGGRTLEARWILAAVGSLAVAFVIWNLTQDGSPLCHPHSLLQGHAAWHLLCAVAAYCLYRYWCSGSTPADARTDVVEYRDERPHPDRPRRRPARP